MRDNGNINKKDYKRVKLGNIMDCFYTITLNSPRILYVYIVQNERTVVIIL